MYNGVVGMVKPVYLRNMMPQEDNDSYVSSAN